MRDAGCGDYLEGRERINLIKKLQPREEAGSWSTDVFRSFSCLDHPPNHMIPLNLQRINTPVVLYALVTIVYTLRYRAVHE
jgi:hypothetical protein